MFQKYLPPRASTKAVPLPHHSDLHVLLSVVVEGEGLGHTLALVVARAHADGVDVAPVLLLLRVLQGVAVHLGRGREQEARLDALRQTWR